MTRDASDVLMRLVQRVPVHVVDLAAARRAGDHEALAYHSAMTAWRAEAAALIAEVREGNPTGMHVPSDFSDAHPQGEAKISVTFQGG